MSSKPSVTKGLELAGHSIVITGGSSGIGLASARAFGALGARVGILARSAEGNQRAVVALAAEGIEAVAVVTDVESQTSTTNGVVDLAEQLGGIDVVICAAGKSGLGGRDLLSVSVAEWDSVMNVNVRGPWFAVRAALPYLRNGVDPAIVVIGSDSAFVSTDRQVPYCTAKGALVSFTRSLAVDLADDRIRVNSVCPSVVDTPMSRSSLGLVESGFEGVSYPVHRAEDIAEITLFLGTRRSQSINGQSLLADYGLSGVSNFPA